MIGAYHITLPPEAFFLVDYITIPRNLVISNQEYSMITIKANTFFIALKNYWCRVLPYDNYLVVMAVADLIPLLRDSYTVL